MDIYGGMDMNTCGHMDMAGGQECPTCCLATSSGPPYLLHWP